jgi:hypothetical protein
MFGKVGFWAGKERPNLLGNTYAIKNKGKKKPPRTEEHRKNASLANKGKPWSEARRRAHLNKTS